MSRMHLMGRTWRMVLGLSFRRVFLGFFFIPTFYLLQFRGEMLWIAQICSLFREAGQGPWSSCRYLSHARFGGENHRSSPVSSVTSIHGLCRKLKEDGNKQLYNLPLFVTVSVGVLHKCGEWRTVFRNHLSVSPWEFPAWDSSHWSWQVASCSTHWAIHSTARQSFSFCRLCKV